MARVQNNAQLLLEVCIETIDDAQAAVAGGAHRLELNAALALGGLTPSIGLVREVRRQVDVPLIAMIRPRPSGFCYSPAEFAVMLRDVEALAPHVDGFAFAVLHADGKIDVDRCRRLVEACGKAEAVFHRAFDVLPDPFGSLEAIVDHGYHRIMTSGQQPTALAGADLIRQLVVRAGGRIEIMPAGGINPTSVREVIAATGCRQLHASLRGERRDSSVAGRPAIRFGRFSTSEEVYDATDGDLVAELLRCAQHE